MPMSTEPTQETFSCYSTVSELLESFRCHGNIDEQQGTQHQPVALLQSATSNQTGLQYLEIPELLDGTSSTQSVPIELEALKTSRKRAVERLIKVLDSDDQAIQQENRTQAAKETNIS